MSGVLGPAGEHSFHGAPHRTMLRLTLPVLVTLIAEPVTGLVDTAFVSRLGSVPLAALGVGTAVLSGVFWIFNFLGIGAQTEVARMAGGRQADRASQMAGMALALAGVFGLLMLVGGLFGAGAAARAMGATDALHADAVVYLRIRLLGAPAVVVSMAAFHLLRGVQDMKTPLRIAIGVNVANVLLDALLIFGVGPVPALGIAGAAWASSAAQWAGAFAALLAVRRRLGFPSRLHVRDALTLLHAGRDLVVRTALLAGFLMLTTRAATRIGPDAGAAHQVVRQVWVLTALLLDAYAATAQSLVGYFLGAARIDAARRVAAVACQWSFGTGILLGLGMLAARGLVATGLVPESARAAFGAAWFVAAVTQPLNALSFATDGIHWGTADYRWLRNAMVAATAVGALALLAVDSADENAMALVWWATGLWITIRALLGMLRVWPGLGRAPLAPS